MTKTQLCIRDKSPEGKLTVLQGNSLDGTAHSEKWTFAHEAGTVAGIQPPVTSPKSAATGNPRCKPGSTY